MAVLTKIKGSTLVEALVAMILILITSGVGFTVYLNVLRQDNFRQKIKAEQVLNAELIETMKSERKLNEVKSYEGMTIQKIVLPYYSEKTKVNDLLLLTLTAYSEDKVRLKEYKIIIEK